MHDAIGNLNYPTPYELMDVMYIYCTFYSKYREPNSLEKCAIYREAASHVTQRLM